MTVSGSEFKMIRRGNVLGAALGITTFFLKAKSHPTPLQPTAEEHAAQRQIVGRPRLAIPLVKRYRFPHYAGIHMVGNGEESRTRSI